MGKFDSGSEPENIYDFFDIRRLGDITGEIVTLWSPRSAARSNGVNPFAICWARAKKIRRAHV